MNTNMQPQTSGQDSMGDEPGGNDNRLSLNPSNPAWSDTVGSWKDGQQYALTVQVRQISPGEFEVIDAQEAEGAGEPSDNATEDASEAPSSSSGNYSSNPAINDLANS